MYILLYGTFSLVTYFILTILISWWASFSRDETQTRTRTRTSSNGDGNTSDKYFMADRDAPFWAVAASLFSSNIGAEHFIGLRYDNLNK